MPAMFRCIRCGASAPSGTSFRCSCGGLYEVEYTSLSVERSLFDERRGSAKTPFDSGVWRFKELIHPDVEIGQVVSRPEGNTNQYKRKVLSEYVGVGKLAVKHEGENPTGSFKDRGMTVAVSEAVRQGATAVACASTGNTSASMAAYAAQAGLRGVVFIPEGEIAFGKLSQALAYGSKVVQIKGNFDDAMRIVEEASSRLNLYLLNSINPWRVEGQKSIVFEMLQQRDWDPPDWIVLPAGNLGNTSAFGKALVEAKKAGLIDRLPRIGSIQAEGANPFYRLYRGESAELVSVDPHTVASAIKIGNPVSWEKAIRVIRETRGVVEQVSDDEIMDAKAVIDASGIGCEPASAASVAGARKLRDAGVINPRDDVVCVLTGNLLKDPDNTVKYHTGAVSGVEPRRANRPVSVDPAGGDLMEELKSVLSATA